MSLKVLFIGGTGNISLPCVKEAVSAGHQVTVFNRGARSEKLPPGVASIAGDLKDAAYRDLGKQGFDVVCQFICFNAAQMQEDVAAFLGKVGQYIFISSASIYEKPPRHYVITEETPTVNPYWPYSQDKIACEAVLKGQRRKGWTIIRPSHTVRTHIPTMFNDADGAAHRMMAGKPVLIAGDGSTPWTLTRCADFAVPFVRLFGKEAALGDAIHITSDNAYTWNDIYAVIADGLGVTADVVHVPTETLVRYHHPWEGPLMGDKTWTAIFDNSKLKRLVGDFKCAKELTEVLAEPIAHCKARVAAAAAPVVGELDPLMDRIAREQRALGA
ncbi:MAG TPA: NAD-dependent epimerase/dehydratase family protein [Magnetospirillaceae bacterium]|jgi:nucleoside-diphosphate-sugar epimerase